MALLDTKKIGERIKVLRKSLNKTQKDFYVFLTGNDQFSNGGSTVGQWERGLHLPSLDNLKDISEKCNVSLDWLVLGQGKRELHEKPMERTREDYCNLLFIEMANKLEATWKLSDDSILYKKTNEKQQFIEYKIPLFMNIVERDDSGYPLFYKLIGDNRHFAESAKVIADVRRGLESVNTRIDKGTIYKNIIKGIWEPQETDDDHILF